jgi:hypothetical protein
VKALLLLLIAPTAYAQGVTTTTTAGRYEARNAAGTMIGDTRGYETLSACEAALPAPTGPGKQRVGTCKLVHHVDKELNCDGVPKPALATFTVLDENVVVYAGPYCAPGETCTTPPDWDNRTFTYTDVGGIRLNDDGTTEELKLVQSPPPACWEWRWLPQSTPVAHVVPDSDAWVPEVDEMDGNGITGDPSWPGYIGP